MKNNQQITNFQMWPEEQKLQVSIFGCKLLVACPDTGEEDCETGLFTRSVECGCEFDVLGCRNPLGDVF